MTWFLYIVGLNDLNLYGDVKITPFLCRASKIGRRQPQTPCCLYSYVFDLYLQQYRTCIENNTTSRCTTCSYDTDGNNIYSV